MKKLIIIFICLFGISCGINEKKCFESVKQTFPNSEIYKSDQCSYRFIIIDELKNGEKQVKLVETLNITDTIVKKEIFDEHIKDKYNVEFVIDDRKSVCNQWVEMGLFLFDVSQDPLNKNYF